MKDSNYIIVKITEENGRLIARDVKSNEIITKPTIWSGVKRIVHDSDLRLARQKTKSGNWIWKKIKPDEVPDDYEPVTPSKQAKKIDKALDSKSFDVTKLTDDEIRVAIQNSYSRKPNELELSELPWKYASRAVLRGQGILLLGHSGCGKTMTARCLAEAYNRPLFKFNMGSMTDARTSLIGNTHYSPEKGTFFAGSDFVKAITTPGALILLDEYTRISPDAENIMMTVLDPDQRYLRVDEDPSNPVISVADGVTFVATANVGVEYTSTRIIDRATKDRFSAIVEVPLLSESAEVKNMKRLFPDVNPKYISAIAKVAEHTRKDKQSDDPKYQTLISTRSTVEQAEMAMDGFYFSEIMEALVFPMFDSEGGVESERAKLRQFIQNLTHLDNESPLKSEQKKAEMTEPEVEVKEKAGDDYFNENEDVF